MMTYAEMTQTTAVLFPTNVSDDFKQVVYDWFQYREVCDDDKFPTFFKRKIAEDYPRYMELLRVEPGHAHYDWLVSMYRELENTKTGTVDSTENRTLSSQGSRNNTTTRTGTSTAEVSQTEQKRGTDTVVTDGTETLNTQDALTGTETLNRTGTQNTVRTPNLSGSLNDTKTTTRGQAIETATQGTTGSTEASDRYGATDAVHVDKILPQESGGISRSSASIGNYGVPELTGMNWQYASNAAEDTSKSAETAGRTSSGTNQQTTTVTPLTGSDQETLARTTSESGTETTGVTNNLQDQTTYNTQRNRTGTIDNDVSEQTTYNSDKNIEGTSEKNITDNSTLAGTNTGSSTEAGTRNVESDVTTHDRYTGRDKAPAELLKEAVQYIKSTCAWEWMYNQLNVCFLATYDV